MYPSFNKQEVPVYEAPATIIKKLGCFITNHDGFCQYE